MAMNEGTNSPLILTIGFVSMFMIVVVAIGVEAWFRHEQRAEVDRQWDANRNTWLEDIKDKQKKNLEDASVDAKTQAKHLPIDQAMKLVVSTYGAAPATQPAARAE